MSFHYLYSSDNYTGYTYVFVELNYFLPQWSGRHSAESVKQYLYLNMR